MRCPQCNAENRDGRKFCGECGAALPAPCPACGFANEPGEKFCGGCGIAIGAAAPAPAATSAEVRSQPTGSEGERRPVTILFSDLSGYTNLSESRDPEDIHRILTHHFEVVDQIVLDHGGTIDKHIGDAVMALFGAPVAHGNDPERAVRTALAIHVAMADMSEELGATLTVHIGIASGQVVASGMGSEAEREYTVTGHSVNLAARLEDQATAGQTLVSDEVYRAVEGIARAESLGEIRMKGLDAAVPVWLLTGFGHDDSAAAAGAIDSCREDNGGQAIHLRAEAGIGKTRLVDEFVRMAETAGFARHTGLCLDFGVAGGHDAIGAIVRSMLGDGDDGERAAAVDEGMADASDLIFLYDLLHLEQMASMHAIYDAMDNETRAHGRRQAIARLMERLAQRQPLLIVIEDLHWAEPAVVDHAAHMVAAAHGLPVLLVMTSRVEGDPIDVEWRRTARPTAVTTVDLQPLGHDDALALAETFLGADSQLAEDCIARAEGNPLFLAELLRGASADGGGELPSSVQNLLLARVDKLPAHDKQALQAASVLGQRFALSVLRALIADRQYLCTGPLDAHLIRRAAGECLFAHALIWASVYNSLLRDRRRQLHLAAAQVQGADDSGLRAQHLDRAEDPGAAAAYVAAAKAGAAAFRFEPALAMLDRAKELTRPGHGQFDILCLRGEALRELARPADSIAEFRAALEVAEGAAERCRARLGMVAAMRLIDAYDEARQMLDEAEAEAEAEADGGLDRALSAIHYFRGSIYFPLGNIEGCLDEHGKALDYAVRAASPEDEAKALSGLGDAHYAGGRMKTSLEHFLRCQGLCRAHGLGRIEVGTLYMIAWTRLYQNEVEAAHDHALGAIETSIRLGHRRAEIVSRLVTAKVLYQMDDLEGAVAQARGALDLADALGAHRFRPEALIYIGRFHKLREGGDAEAQAVLDEAWEEAQRTSVQFIGPWVLASIAQTSTDPQRIAWALREGQALLDKGSIGHNYYSFYCGAMEVALGAGDWAECERFAAALATYTAPEPLPHSDYYIARGRALAALGRDPKDEKPLAQARLLLVEGERVGLRRAVPALAEALARSG